MDNDIELYLDIDDDFKHVHGFDVSVEYSDTHDKFINHVRISITTDVEIIAYLECAVFYDDMIAESRYNHVYWADSMTQDVYDAMVLLEECSLLSRTEENQTIGELLTNYPYVTVYLHHIAVKEDFRGKGIGNWLLRNLSRILQRNYSVFPRQIITLISPQTINWNTPTPSFSDPTDETAENNKMHEIMAQMFEKNGYEQQKDTRYYLARDNI